MKTLIIFYSYTGHTRAEVQKLVSKKTIDIQQIKDVRKPGKLKAYLLGSFAAMRGKGWVIESLNTKLDQYDHFIVLSPVWAGNPPPAVNSLLQMLPKNKTVSVKMVSGSGKSKCKEKIEAVIKSRDCKMDSFEDIKA